MVDESSLTITICQEKIICLIAIDFVHNFPWHLLEVVNRLPNLPTNLMYKKHIEKLLIQTNQLQM